ncbi:hypothetical protein [Corallococcus sp. AB049A]|uniref:hypothetical protein n=1 Tax=Corallococcus sp. AB049A TaxID=2316721 RepID=UPI0011C38693|nr:hypothetical protein [Corallococcus sp. AB049A]
MCLSLLSLGMSGCGDPSPTRLVFSLNTASVGASSLPVPASGVHAMTDPAGPPEIMSSDGMRFALNEVRMEVADIRVELGEGMRCGDLSDPLPQGTGCEQPEGSPATLTLAGPFSIDLSTGKAWKGGELRLPPGTYRRVSFVLGEGGFSARTLALDGQSWNMTIFLSGGTVMGFESPHDVRLEEGGLLHVTFVHSQWLTDLPLGACYRNGNLSRVGSEMVLDNATGACEGALEKARDAIRTRGRVSVRSP